MTRKAPYTHPDGSNCWTKDCRIRRSAQATLDTQKKQFMKDILEAQKNKEITADEAKDLHTKIDAIATQEEFDAAVANQEVSRQRHPEYPYSIYKYSQGTTFSKNWNKITMASRGLIVNDETGEILARPFPKFFNYSENATPVELMQGPISVMEKLDGCFTSGTALNLWGGGTITIGEIVKNKLTPKLVGLNEQGKLVPTQVTNWFDNGSKSEWLNIFLDSPTSIKSGAGGHPTRMQVTPNHHLLLNGKYAPASSAKIGDTLIGQIRTLSEEALHLIRSSLLGDGCITNSGKHAKYQESHSFNQLDYVQYMRGILGDTVQTRSGPTKSGFGSEMHWVGTKEYEQLDDMRNIWYPEGKKVIPEDISWIDDFTVAIWHMDDGTLAHSKGKYQQDRAVFSTNGFSQEDVIRLGERLTNMYGVSYAVFHDRGWNLRINAGRDSSINKMWEAIAPHIHPSLRYKLPESYRNVDFIPYASTNELSVTKKVTITRIENTVMSPLAKTVKAYDISTETENYMANGVIVHNSLGILYPTPDGLQISTAGGFQSPQGAHATAVYRERYDGKWKPRKNTTYLYEILYKENRIVLDYDNEDDIHLLGAVNIKTGKSIPISELKEWKWKRAEEFSDFKDVNSVVAAPDRSNHEGYIVHFTDTDTRVKIKHEEYLKLHRFATGINGKFIHNLMRDGTSAGMDSWRQNAPEEFEDYVTEKINTFTEQYNKEYSTVESYHKAVKDSLPAGYSQKDFALKANETVPSKYRGLVFSLHNRGELDDKAKRSIWNMFEPAYERSVWSQKDNVAGEDDDN